MQISKTQKADNEMRRFKNFATSIDRTLDWVAVNKLVSDFFGVHEEGSIFIETIIREKGKDPELPWRVHFDLFIFQEEWEISVFSTGDFRNEDHFSESHRVYESKPDSGYNGDLEGYRYQD